MMARELTRADLGGALLRVVRLLETVWQFYRERGRWPYTREVLSLLRSWGCGQETLRVAELLGLIERYDGYCSARARRRRLCRFNALTDGGLRVLRAARALRRALEAGRDLRAVSRFPG
jgi:hypothetical protein